MNNKNILMNEIDFSIGDYSYLYIDINFNNIVDKTKVYKIYYNHDNHIIICILLFRKIDDDLFDGDDDLFDDDDLLYSIHNKTIYRILTDIYITDIKEYIIDLNTIFDDISINISYQSFSSNNEITINNNETTSEKFIKRAINMFNIFTTKNKNKH